MDLILKTKNEIDAKGNLVIAFIKHSTIQFWNMIKSISLKWFFGILVMQLSEVLKEKR